MEKKDLLNPFELSIPTNETMVSTVMTTDDILVLTQDRQKTLRNELDHLILMTFPRLCQEYRDELAEGYFDRPRNGLTRYVFLVKNRQTDLIASTLFDYGQFDYHKKTFNGIYSILRVVSPGYEGMGIAQQMAIQEFIRFTPDVLFSTSYQSSALHSWIRLCEKHILSGYEVFPRLEQKNGDKKLVTVPFRDLEFAVSSFLSLYRGFAQNEETINRATKNLTLFLARKNAHGESYDHHPWEKGGRKDRLASELGLGEQDAMLVMFRKID